MPKDQGEDWYKSIDILLKEMTFAIATAIIKSLLIIKHFDKKLP